MSNDLAVFSSPKLRDIAQDMRELLSQSHLALLLGAGCSKAAGLPLMSSLTDEVLAHEVICEETRELLREVSGSFSGAKSVTIEDYMSEIVDLLSIVERRSRRGAELQSIPVGGKDRDLATLQRALSEVKHAISIAIGEKEVDVVAHQQFIRAIHGSLQAGKADRKVDYYILNYDTLIEDALGLERIAYCDGFDGAATGWWEPNVFSVKGKAARVFKLHGSIDWCLLAGDPCPRRVRTGIKSDSSREHILIYPAATKYQETQRDPFAQLLNLMRHGISPVEGKEMVLAICGYKFGDAHIDFEVESALRQSEGRLTLAAFVSTDGPEGRLYDWLLDPSLADQIRVYANKGFYHGDTVITVEADIPWWKFEVLARFLGGER